MDAAVSMQNDCPDEPYSKRRDCKLVDGISNLPDEIKTDIITLLPIQNAIQTSVLSRSWSRIFSSLPRLVFEEIHFPAVVGEADDMVKSINWTLAQHDASDVDTLTIRFNIWHDGCPLMNDAWVNFAVQHNVQNLKLFVRIDEGRDFPSSVFTCKSLKTLYVQTRCQILRLPSYIFLPNIKKLLFYSIKFPADTLTEQLFSGCPLLDSMTVRECCVSLLTRFSISSKKLKILNIINVIGVTGCGIYLECPSLETFAYEGAMAQDFEFRNVDLLHFVNLNGQRDVEDGRNDNVLAGLALKLLTVVSTARSLTINFFFNMILYNIHNELWRLTSFKNLTYACLCLFGTEEDEDLLLELLRKFRQVQKLRIVMERNLFSKMLYFLQWRTEHYPLEEILSHLQYVEIVKFKGRAFELGFLRFLLKNAKSLTEIRICMPVKVGGQYWVNRSPILNEQFKDAIRSKVEELKNCFPAVRITI